MSDIKNKKFVQTFTPEQKKVIRSFFNDSEWDAIDCALSDYKDYGEEEKELTEGIHGKMYHLFNS